MSQPTIFAVASGAVRAAVSVLRISGPESAAVSAQLCGSLPEPRRASLRRIRSASGEILDRALVLWLPGPGTYTGEDSAELQLHGGRAVVEAVSAALVLAGARPAEPGEFSRRAFLHGKMDLLEAEGVADLVAAETEAQRRQALRQMDGAQSQQLTQWAARLRHMLAHQEALIDFPDEAIPPEIESALLADIADLSRDLSLAIEDAARGTRVREGLSIAIIGAPNAGKSSLVNALSSRDVAIVAPTAGTTRDALEVALDIAGVKVTLIDTAGLRDTPDPVEAEGVRRARARAAAADMVLHVLDSTTQRNAVPATDAAAPNETLYVANKIDLAPALEGLLGVSAASGAGLADLRNAIETRVLKLTQSSGPTSLSRARHVAALREAVAALDEAAAATLPELRGEELRLAMQSLGRLTGAVDVEAILDDVFGAFCIGK